ncbi:MAG: PEP-CTERM sorting domain-containing protein [Telmatospirillum sp.]|nr:PEP-CTERM sorting domain-containing protein [Telmatospirillum sp.]
MINNIKIIAFALLLSICGIFDKASAGVIYSSDFSKNSSSHHASEFTGANAVTTAPGDAFTGNKPISFLGVLTQGATATLRLTGLNPYEFVRLNFDLYALNSLDGDGQDGYGPDIFSVYANNKSIMSNTFSGYLAPSTTTQNYPVNNSKAGSGQSAFDVPAFGMQSTYSMVSIYNISLNATAGGDGTISFGFSGRSSEPWPNEGFGVNNIVVMSNVPEPVSIFLFGVGLIGIGLFARPRSLVKI